MHRSLGNPEYIDLGGSRRVLKSAFVYVTERTRCTIVVPKGFITDGASSPFHVLITAWGGHYPVAALVHDYLYDRLGQKKPHRCAPTRKTADLIFLEVMRRSGVHWFVRLAMFAAVRMFGGDSFIKEAVVR